MNTGIYQILNLINGKRYIGSAAGRGFDDRWDKHRKQLGNKQHHSIKLQRAWDKYGVDSFVFEIIEKCESVDCIRREQHYLDTVLFASCNNNKFNKLGYNICRIAGSTLGVKLSDQTRQRMSIAKRGINNYCTKLTIEDIKQIISLL